MTSRGWIGALAALVVMACSGTAEANQLVTIEIPARHGEIAQPWVGYDGPPKARVLLPDSYSRGKAYPLLVLLGGLDNDYTTWSSEGAGDAQHVLAGLPAIVVMPEGSDGWYADWYNGGKRADPAWESYILDEVIPQVLRRYEIRPERRYHALAGASMGGLGSAYLGGRLPGFFGSVAILSGLVDLAAAPSAGETAVMTGASYALAGQVPTDPYAIFGPPSGFYELGHNPVELAPNYGQTRVFMTTGDGTPASDSTSPAGGDNVKEGVLIKPTMDNLAAAFAKAAVDYRYDIHPGYHDWPNFHRELRDMAAWGLFKPVDEHATSWVNDTVASHGKLWEFAYRFDAPPDRVVRIRRAGSVLSVGAAGSPVTITSDDGCRRHVATPAQIAVRGRSVCDAGGPLSPR